MKTVLVFCVCLLCCSAVLADTHYVDIYNLSPVSPYTNWTSAATSIQVAIVVASSNDTVLVAAGLYNESITLKSGVVLQGAGADTTVIEGAGEKRGHEKGVIKKRGQKKGAVRLIRYFRLKPRLRSA